MWNFFLKQVLQHRRQQVMELPDEAAQELLAEIEEDEEVPIVPAKLLNNTAVLLYRWAVICIRHGVVRRVDCVASSNNMLMLVFILPPPALGHSDRQLQQLAMLC